MDASQFSYGPSTQTHDYGDDHQRPLYNNSGSTLVIESVEFTGSWDEFVYLTIQDHPRAKGFQYGHTYNLGPYMWTGVFVGRAEWKPSSTVTIYHDIQRTPDPSYMTMTLCDGQKITIEIPYYDIDRRT